MPNEVFHSEYSCYARAGTLPQLFIPHIDPGELIVGIDHAMHEAPAACWFDLYQVVLLGRFRALLGTLGFKLLPSPVRGAWIRTAEAMAVKKYGYGWEFIQSEIAKVKGDSRDLKLTCQSPVSPHLTSIGDDPIDGLACANDVYVVGYNPRDPVQIELVINLAFDVGFTEVGVYPWKYPISDGYTKSGELTLGFHVSTRSSLYWGLTSTMMSELVDDEVVENWKNKRWHGRRYFCFLGNFKRIAKDSYEGKDYIYTLKSPEGLVSYIRKNSDWFEGV